MANFFPFVSWTYRTSKHTSIRITPLSFVYGVDAMILIEVVILLARLTLTSKVSDSRDHIYDVEHVNAYHEKDRRLRMNGYLTKNKFVDL